MGGGRCVQVCLEGEDIRSGDVEWHAMRRDAIRCDRQLGASVLTGLWPGVLEHVT